ncbi:hypothetical protein NX059_008499 [Plenodomus lindquistii]|nr:hypothetical protein NX059_008499 [Plenodomus lindquistii]
MSVLAFKALSYGAEQIPDKFFEKIPGGFFSAQDTKDIKQGRKDRKDDKDRERQRSEDRSERRNSRRDRSPPTDYSDHSAYDDNTDYERERERRKRERRRAKSAGRSSSRSLSRGKNTRSSRDLDGENSDSRDMAQPEQGAPYFPPPPTGEYKPYNPQDYSPPPAQNAHRPSSAIPAYGYSPQPAAAQAYIPQQSSGLRDAPRSAASRYTPGPGYAPSPPVDPAFPPPPVGTRSPPYSPYNPSDYPPGNASYGSNTYPSPPPFERQRSNSQPPYAYGGNAPYPTYIPPSADQQVVTSSDQPLSRRGSTRPRREHRHRAMSADSHSRSSKDHRQDSSRMGKVRERFDGMDSRERGLAATVGGALAGGLAGRQMGKSRLTTLVGAAAGAIGGRTFADQRSKSRGERRSRSRSRSRFRSRSRSRARSHNHERSKDTGLRARSRSIIDRFRSKSRGPDERDSRADRRDRRPDHGYDRDGDEYDYFSSESEGDGSPVQTRRRRRRDY